MSKYIILIQLNMLKYKLFLDAVVFPFYSLFLLPARTDPAGGG